MSSFLSATPQANSNNNDHL